MGLFFLRSRLWGPLAPLVCLALCGCPAAPLESPTTKVSTGPFTLIGPREAIEVLHGQDQPVEITIDWKVPDREPVELSAQVEPRDRGVKVRSEDNKVIVSVMETALSGTTKVTVTGKTSRHGSASTTFEVKVPRKDRGD